MTAMQLDPSRFSDTAMLLWIYPVVDPVTWDDLTGRFLADRVATLRHLLKIMPLDVGVKQVVWAAIRDERRLHRQRQLLEKRATDG